jgi:hypothetical protein
MRAPAAGDVIEGFGGLRLEIVSLSGEALVMEASYPGDGDFPPVHLHPRQAERFEVLEGAILARVGDAPEARHARGAVFEVPAATPHTMRADGPARTRWEVRPALRTAEFFATLYGGQAGPGFLDDFADEFRLVAT